jgi:hypothetical protein
LALAMILMGALASGSALAYGHVRVGIGIGIGGPVFWPGYYPGPYYYPYYYYPPYPAVVTVPATPTTYVEQSQPQAAPGPAPSASWYYCADSRTYYPYVKQCPGGWQQVSPQPQPSPPQ